MKTPCLFILLFLSLAATAQEIHIAPSALCRDPIFDRAADPELEYNYAKKLEDALNKKKENAQTNDIACFRPKNLFFSDLAVV